jgi:amino acid transporter
MAHVANGYTAVPAADGDDGDASNAAQTPAMTESFADDGDLELQSSRLLSSSVIDLATPAADPAPAAAPPKHLLTLTNSLALILGLQIGSGIFAAPSQVSAHALSSPVVGLSVWLLGGLLVWTGAASLAELGLALPPRNGGVMEYLRLGWAPYGGGDFAALTFAWAWAGVVKPCALALTAIVFAENTVRGVAPEALADRVLVKGVAVVGLAAVLLVNCRGARTGARVGDWFMWMKVVIIVSIPCLGVVSLWTVGRPPAKVGPVLPEVGDPWMFVGEYTTALFGALFCYGGWETARLISSVSGAALTLT